MKFEIAPKETEVILNWDDARLYCFALNIDGKTGWRLPTKEELFAIYQTRNDFVKRGYWSSTEFDTIEAWGQNFINGDQYYYDKGNNYYVRAIRSVI